MIWGCPSFFAFCGRAASMKLFQRVEVCQNIATETSNINALKVKYFRSSSQILVNILILLSIGYKCSEVHGAPPSRPNSSIQAPAGALP